MTEERTAEQLHGADAAASTLGITLVSADASGVELRMTVRDDMLNFGGTCHGGALFHLADTAMSYLSNAGTTTSVATAASIDFVAPAFSGTTLHAVGTTVLAARNAVHDVTIKTAHGEVIAIFRGKTLGLKAASPTAPTQTNPTNPTNG